MRKLTAAAVCIALFAVSSAGCRRRANSPLVPAATGRPTWSPTDLTVIEGRSTTATLSLNRIPASDPVDVSIDADEAGQVSAPTTVTFAVGDTSESVTIGGIPLETDAVRVTVLTASTNNGISELVVSVIDDDATSGAALGPVTVSTGRVAFVGAGTDALQGTADDEFVVASGIGSATPAFTRTPIGPVFATDAGIPVVTGVNDAVLVLGSAGTIPLLSQVQGLSGTPAVSDTINLTGVVGNVARPVMVGARAVLVSRGLDGVPSIDDSLIIIDGIGTASLSSRSVTLPGLAAGDPSVPVPVGPDAFVIVTAGIDFQFGTGDESLVLVSGLAGTPTTLPVAAGRIHGSAAGRAVVSGGTVAAVMTAGLDTTFGTTDDALQVVRGLPGAPAPALPFVVGPAATGPEGLPVGTGVDSLVLPLLGTDAAYGTSDDELAVVASLSADPMSVSAATTADPASGAAGRIVLLSGTVAVRLRKGADGALGTADDGLVMVTSLDTVPATSTTTIGALQAAAPLPTSATSVAFAGRGLDGAAGSSDDRTWSVTGIGSSPLARSFVTGAFSPLGAVIAVPTPSGFSLAAVTAGEDAAPATADDRLSVTVVP